MLVDVLVALSIMGLIAGALIAKGPVSLGEKNAMAGTVLLKMKLQAMNQSKYTDFVVENQQLNGQYPVSYNDCRLRFTPRGTTAASGTCRGKNHSISLRPGEGGMGYPWH